MYVRFVDEKGFAISPVICMERLPGPGEEIRLEDNWYVVQPAPIRNEPLAFPSGLRHVPHVVVSPRSREIQRPEAPPKETPPKPQSKLFREAKPRKGKEAPVY